MLSIVIPGGEVYDRETNTFSNMSEVKLQLEHSLISVTKWESKWHKPFLSTEKTTEETLDYIRCMIIGKEVDISVLRRLSNKEIKEIQDYINNPMTATWFSDNGNRKSKNREVITNELIYYWMAGNQIPFECEKWHLNRLLTLLEVFAAKNEEQQGKNKMSKKEILQQNAKINAARRAAMKKPKV